MKTILVLEHDTLIRALIRFVIEQSGYKMQEATSPRAVFERFEENHSEIDLLIADVTAPEFSGIRVALDLWALLPNLKIVLMSGRAGSMCDGQTLGKLEKFPSSNWVAVLGKPFFPVMLLDAIHRLIGLPYEVAPALQMNAAS